MNKRILARSFDFRGPFALVGLHILVEKGLADHFGGKVFGDHQAFGGGIKRDLRGFVVRRFHHGEGFGEFLRGVGDDVGEVFYGGEDCRHFHKRTFRKIAQHQAVVADFVIPVLSFLIIGHILGIFVNIPDDFQVLDFFDKVLGDRPGIGIGQVDGTAGQNACGCGDFLADGVSPARFFLDIIFTHFFKREIALQIKTDTEVAVEGVILFAVSDGHIAGSPQIDRPVGQIPEPGHPVGLFSGKQG